MSRWIHVIFNRQVSVLQEGSLEGAADRGSKYAKIPSDFAENIETERAEDMERPTGLDACCHALQKKSVIRVFNERGGQEMLMGQNHGWV
jgi:hypothetical protein